MTAHPCLTADLPGVGGRIKSTPADFVVEEIPAYEPSGTGEHLFLWIEKVDLSAEQLLRHLSRTLGVSQGEIGMAGLKDRRAITRQWVSVPASCAARVESIDTEQVQVLRAVRHPHKLRTGHLRGNRFVVIIDDVPPGNISRAEQIAARLLTSGMVNWYGEQRFGHAEETLTWGLALLRGERSEREIPPSRRKFFSRLAISAVQSWLFNRVAEERIRHRVIDVVLPGDVLQVRSSGGLFVSEATEVDQARLASREVVTTGPMYGEKMKRPCGAAAELEDSIREECGICLKMWHKWRRQAPGTRRPLLVFFNGLSCRAESDSRLALSFELPSGAYATSLLHEFTRD